jgi:L-lactate utilization protein LutC
MERCVTPIFSCNDINDPRATQIIEGLYLGDEEGANDEMLLDELKIKRIVRVGEELKIKNPEKYEYMSIDVYDHDNEDLYKHFENTFKFIDEALTKKENVLVHCKYGISRSATIVISYIIQKFKYRAIEAIAFVSSKRSIINPNNGFIKQLSELDLRVSSHFLDSKQFGVKTDVYLPIQDPYVKRKKASCRIKLKEDEVEKDVIEKKPGMKIERMNKDKLLVKFYQIISAKREELIHLQPKQQKEKILELIEDKDIFSQIGFSIKKRLSKLEETRRFRNIRRRLKNNVPKILEFLFSSQFDKDYGNKLK